jgi:TolB-like protein/DNA-binding winged helix-turn-helix (wHTH) protein/Tfp pilus assembly protein PilF
MDGLAEDVFLFEGFRLDRRAGGLFRADENGVLVAVAIGARALDLLILLVRRHGDLVSKDEIMTAVWPSMIVEDSNLPTQISALRRVLDQERSNGSCIQTVVGRGYRFVAAVTHAAAEARLDRSRIISNREQAEHRTSGPVALFTIDACKRWRPLRYIVSVAASTHRLAAISALAFATAIGAFVLSVGGWWLWTTTKSSPVVMPIPQPFVAPRLSIVVLPFANLSNDPEQQYFADGITDDLTTDLSRLADMSVIARNTALTYRNKPVDAKQIGRELGVQYLLEGGVQRSGNQVRINAQLIEAEANAHLWAERFDRDLGDLFAIQNEITTQLAVALKIELISTEAARSTERADVLDYILRARAVYMRPISRENHAEAISLFERALALGSQSAEAQSWLAAALAGRVLANMTDSAAADVERASQLSAQAVASLPRSPVAHEARGEVLRAQRRYAEAIPEYETVLALDRNWVYALFALGQCKLNTGSIEETIPLVERAIRLSPRDPALGVWYENIGLAHLLQSHIDEAVMWLEKARNRTPAHSMIRADLAAAYGLAGETERAAAELAEARRLSPTDRYSSLSRLQAVYTYGVPKIRALREATYFAGLRKAGMPEE